MNDEQIKQWQEEQASEQRKAVELIPTLIGTTLDEAQKAANENNLQHRVRSINGKGCIGTCDLKPARLNFKVENDLIKDITLG